MRLDTLALRPERPMARFQDQERPGMSALRLRVMSDPLLEERAEEACTEDDSYDRGRCYNCDDEVVTDAPFVLVVFEFERRSCAGAFDRLGTWWQ